MGHRCRLTLLLFVLAACSHKSPSPKQDGGKPDELARGEFPEAKEPLYSLAVPRGTRVTYRFHSQIIAETPIPPEQLSNFVQARVKGAAAVRGTASTKWDKVTTLKEPGRLLEIEVRPSRSTYPSEIRVTDVTPPPIDPNQTEADRWKAVGITPDGKIIDRKNLQ